MFKKIYGKLKNDYKLKSFIFLSISFIVSIAFMLYNLFMGLYFNLPFNIAICPYYVCLIILKLIVLLFEKINRNDKDIDEKRLNFVKVLSGFLLIADFLIVAPIVLMVLLQRQVDIGTVPAIAVAAFTTYKVTIAIINYRKTVKINHPSLRILRVINILDAIVSILTLQNTLIMTFGDATEMLTLTSYTNLGLIALMVSITIIFIFKLKKEKTSQI